MFKKALATAAVAAVLLFSGAAAAHAYAPDVTIAASPTTVAPGGSAVITVTDVPEGIDEVTFAVTAGPSGATLASLVFAAAADVSATKPVDNGIASATFTATTEGTYTITATGDDGTDLGTVTVTVTADAEGELPDTGGTLPIAALWVGVGALGLGGLAVVAAAARRRAQQR